jgi:hypothetical protein
MYHATVAAVRVPLPSCQCCPACAPRTPPWPVGVVFTSVHCCHRSHFYSAVLTRLCSPQSACSDTHTLYITGRLEPGAQFHRGTNQATGGKLAPSCTTASRQHRRGRVQRIRAGGEDDNRHVPCVGSQVSLPCGVVRGADSCWPRTAALYIFA